MVKGQPHLDSEAFLPVARDGGHSLSVLQGDGTSSVDFHDIIENRRLLQDRGGLSRIVETAATARLQVGVTLVHEM